MTLRKPKKTRTMTMIVLLVSFIILVGRLIFVVPGAFEHHQQKKQDVPPPVTATK